MLEDAEYASILFYGYGFVFYSIHNPPNMAPRLPLHVAAGENPPRSEPGCERRGGRNAADKWRSDGGRRRHISHAENGVMLHVMKEGLEHGGGGAEGRIGVGGW